MNVSDLPLVLKGELWRTNPYERTGLGQPMVYRLLCQYQRHTTK